MQRCQTPILVLLLCLSLQTSPGQNTLAASPRGSFGSSSQSVSSQRSHETRALQLVDPHSAERFLHDVTREPHHAGSAGGRRTAEYVQKRLELFGFESRISEYHVLLSYPKEIAVTLLQPEQRNLRIRENEDFHPDALIPFNAYSPSGDVTAEVVFANFGFSDDYATLQEMGVDVRGKIVIARYGKGYRGLKVRDATAAGAVGMILYSDPIDDGYTAGEVYPKGPMRPWDAVQRGSIRFLESYPGDPLTPGYPATQRATRRSPDEDPDLPRIPCTPLSYEDAQHLLRGLEGPVVPRPWQGGLPFTYHVGPGPTRIRMKLTMDFQIRAIWNNIAVLRGSAEPERLVILGGHRDPWVFGAQDPNSGTAVLLETARILGKAVQGGWKPKRTIVIAQWDAEEFGMIGSTEWGEEFRDMLRKNAVVYINFDGSVSGPNFGASAVPSLDHFIQTITKEVNDPGTDASIFASWWKNQNKSKLKTLEDVIPEKAAVNIGRMGGGSDHVVFLNHIGVPAMGFGFGGPSGIYHSYYDNFDWMKRFGDPEFTYHAAAAKLAVLAAMRLSSCDILPFAYSAYADEIIRQLRVIETRLKDRTDGDPLIFSSLFAKMSEWKTLAERSDRELAERHFTDGQARVLNDYLMEVERLFAPDPGIPGRDWYRHRVVVSSGYASIGLPGISGALEQDEWPTLKSETLLFESIIETIIDRTRILLAALGASKE